MNSAIERLATELMKLPDDEWARVTARWQAGLDWHTVFGPAWDRIAASLDEIDHRPMPPRLAGETDQDYEVTDGFLVGAAGSGAA